MSLRDENWNLYHIADEHSEAISQTNATRLYRTSKASISQKEAYMNDKTIKELAVELTVETTAICDNIKGRSVFVNQLLCSCSSIGANSHEAKYAQSKADFISKMEIALKECYETEYWLEILFKVNSIDETTYKNLINKCGTIRRKLIASVTTAKSRN
jgi:four helix bundle protein